MPIFRADIVLRIELSVAYGKFLIVTLAHLTLFYPTATGKKQKNLIRYKIHVVCIIVF